MSKLWWRTWERLSLYLPLLLMGVLALATYWLVQSTPVFSVSQSKKGPLHAPDYFVNKFSIRAFDRDGRLNSEVSGQRAKHYPDTDILEIEDARIIAFNRNDFVTTATAQQALANSDASEIQLLGQAHVVRDAVAGHTKAASPRFEYRGEFLHVFMKTEQVRSHKPVELIRGRNHFFADSLDFDNVDQVLLLKGRVKGSLQPGGEKR